SVRLSGTSPTTSLLPPATTGVQSSPSALATCDQSRAIAHIAIAECPGPVSLLLEQNSGSAFSTQSTRIAPLAVISISVLPKQPEHGTAEIAAATSFPNFERENIRYRCNQNKVRGQQVNYKSAEKYIGSDTLDLLVLLPGGFAQEVHINMDVR